MGSEGKGETDGRAANPTDFFLFFHVVTLCKLGCFLLDVFLLVG